MNAFLEKGELLLTKRRLNALHLGWLWWLALSDVLWRERRTERRNRGHRHRAKPGKYVVNVGPAGPILTRDRVPVDHSRGNAPQRGVDEGHVTGDSIDVDRRDTQPSSDLSRSGLRE